MPIQIKKPEFKKFDKKYRISCLISLGAAVLFMAALIGLMGKISNEADKLASTLLFAAYILLFGCCFYSMYRGVKAYTAEDNTADLFQCAFFLAAIIFCFMNLRFALILIFSAYGLNSAADSLRGEQTYSEFISTQYSNWVCMIIGCVLIIIAGIFAAVKLIKYRKKK